MITIKAEITIDSTKTLTINSRNLVDFDLQLLDRENNDQPSFGIRSNSGNLVFNDYDQVVLGYSNSGLLDDYKRIVITIYNTFSPTNCKETYTFWASDWDYDNDSRQVTVTFRDKLENMQNINISGVNWIVDGTMKDLYNALMNNTQSALFGFESSADLDDETQEALSSIKCEYLYLESSSLWDAWNKLATVCMCVIFYDGHFTNFKYVGGTK